MTEFSNAEVNEIFRNQSRVRTAYCEGADCPSTLHVCKPPFDHRKQIELQRHERPSSVQIHQAATAAPVRTKRMTTHTKAALVAVDIVSRRRIRRSRR
jgi:hypothetical protein